MHLKATIAATLAVCLGACNTPTYECRNGRDTSGRGPNVSFDIRCAPLGSDLSCLADRWEDGYCAGPDRDVTTTATWISTNPRVADFDPAKPGFLKVFAPGEVTVLATYDTLRSPAPTFFVAPGVPPLREVSIGINVIRVGSSVRIPDVAIEISPEGAERQRCMSNENSFCRFTSRMAINGAIDVSVAKDGYAPIRQTLRATSPNLSVAIELTPLEQ
jgi:hypothetical protein